MKTKIAKVLRPCAVCKGPVTEKPLQDERTARACQPRCARELAYQEHPELGSQAWTAPS